jgi:hypothetical protein
MPRPPLFLWGLFGSLRFLALGHVLCFSFAQMVPIFSRCGGRIHSIPTTPIVSITMVTFCVWWWLVLVGMTIECIWQCFSKASSICSRLGCTKSQAYMREITLPQEFVTVGTSTRLWRIRAGTFAVAGLWFFKHTAGITITITFHVAAVAAAVILFPVFVTIIVWMAHIYFF